MANFRKMDSPLIRKTRRMEYFEMEDGLIGARPRNKDVTEYSFVISQAIEYRKEKSPRAKRVPAARPLPRPANSRAFRDAANARAERATKRYKTIDLEAITVPKPNKIRNNKQKRKPKYFIHRIMTYRYIYSIPFSFFLFHSA